jgi:hypothetical protein
MDNFPDTELFHIDPDLMAALYELEDEDLRSFAELHEDPTNDGQIELCVFAYFSLFVKTLLTAHLERALQGMEEWLAATDPEHPDCCRRSQIFDMISAKVDDGLYAATMLPGELDKKLMHKKDLRIAFNRMPRAHYHRNVSR